LGTRISTRMAPAGRPHRSYVPTKSYTIPVSVLGMIFSAPKSSSLQLPHPPRKTPLLRPPRKDAILISSSLLFSALLFILAMGIPARVSLRFMGIYFRHCPSRKLRTLNPLEQLPSPRPPLLETSRLLMPRSVLSITIGGHFLPSRTFLRWVIVVFPRCRIARKRG